ncbi:hypothetical protein WMY93_027008 [Mugilogobius chulae]|uniref:Uncharacterized protein n=1 Tax=Mugilogobius chulae TaxID=88201 RepID=A0AAW0N2M6_9GOBI
MAPIKKLSVGKEDGETATLRSSVDKQDECLSAVHIKRADLAAADRECDTNTAEKRHKRRLTGLASNTPWILVNVGLDRRTFPTPFKSRRPHVPFKTLLYLRQNGS